MGISPFEFQKLLARMQSKNKPAALSGGDPVESGQELKLHSDIMQFCNEQWPPWVFIHTDPTGKSRATPGAPDFVIYSNVGVLSFECKTKTGKRSEDQTIFAHLARQCGHEIEIVRSMDDFRALIAREKQKTQMKANL